MTAMEKPFIQQHSAQKNSAPCIVFATEKMLDNICAIEQACQENPWTRGNFSDSLKAGYQVQALLASENGAIMGYYVAIKGVDEIHLLNIAVAPAFQKQGCAQLLLETLRLWAIAEQVPWIWLEVRQSNTRAQHVYERFGFCHVGTRKNYYALTNGGYEHAMLMSLQVC